MSQIEIEKNNKLITKVTDSYSIYVGIAEQSETKIEVYKIVNTATWVAEGETSILPRAYAYCLSFESDLKDVHSGIDLMEEKDSWEKETIIN